MKFRIMEFRKTVLCIVVFALQGASLVSALCPTVDTSTEAVNSPCADLRYTTRQRCYNTTVSTSCCNKCEKFESPDTDCLYGDRDPGMCFNLRKSDCYDPNIEQLCCKTCSVLKTDSEVCPYGDRDTSDFCTNLKQYQCYDASTRFKCCETCQERSNTTCLYGDRVDEETCLYVYASLCYDPDMQYNCCGICEELRDESKPGCAYGDREEEPCYNLERYHCYNVTERSGCCQTCSGFENPQLPYCAFGDRDPSQCELQLGRECNDPEVRNRCCQTCTYLQDQGCLDGDEGDENECWSLNSYQCYDDATSQRCCHTCEEHFKPRNPGCSYGDRVANCHRKARAPHHCYNEQIESRCCETCSYFRYPHAPANCSYGDHTPGECFFIDDIECYKDEIRDNCCETCFNVETDNPECRYYDRIDTCWQLDPRDCYNVTKEADCCSTCPSHEKPARYGDSCRYGDRGDICNVRGLRHKCYDDAVRFSCCASCQDIENADNVGCEFGSKTGDCSFLKKYECYSREDECCEECPNMAMDLVDCRYGDRLDSCPFVDKIECYNAKTRYDCCETCHHHEDTSRPECPFGDEDTACYSSYCQSYDPARLSECCHACRNYSAATTVSAPTTTTTTTTTTTPTTTSTTTTSTTTTSTTTTSTTTTSTTLTTNPTTPTPTGTTLENVVATTEAQTQGWVVPTAAGVSVGVVLVIVLVLLAVWWTMRRKADQPKAFGQNTLPSHYEVDGPNRGNATNQRNQNTTGGAIANYESQDDDTEYASINPDDVKSVLGERTPTENKPVLPPTTGAYMEPITNEATYHILEPMGNGVAIFTPRPGHSSQNGNARPPAGHSPAPNNRVTSHQIGNPAYSSRNPELVSGIQTNETPGYATLTPEYDKPEHDYSHL